MMPCVEIALLLKIGDSRLVPGQFVRVNVIGFSRPDAIIVPQRAVQQGPRGAFVWTVDKDNKAQQRPVVAGDWMGDQWLVSEGLKDGDRVIVDGFLRLAPGAPVQAKEVPAEPLPQRAAAPASQQPASQQSASQQPASQQPASQQPASQPAGAPRSGHSRAGRPRAADPRTQPRVPQATGSTAVPAPRGKETTGPVVLRD